MNPEDIPLRDLHLPAVGGWWPPAPGWWLLFALLLLGFAWFARKAYRRWRRNAARRLALQHLAAIREDFKHGADPVVLARQLSELLRRAMLAYAPRRELAGLTGKRWLLWLDRGLPRKPFSEGAGGIVESLPYMNPDQVADDTDVSGLIDAVHQRIRTPLPEGVP